MDEKRGLNTRARFVTHKEGDSSIRTVQWKRHLLSRLAQTVPSVVCIHNVPGSSLSRGTGYAYRILFITLLSLEFPLGI
jgi:hypothetical protein